LCVMCKELDFLASVTDSTSAIAVSSPCMPLVSACIDGAVVCADCLPSQDRTPLEL
jgi:hypothetical protein